MTSDEKEYVQLLVEDEGFPALIRAIEIMVEHAEGEVNLVYLNGEPEHDRLALVKRAEAQGAKKLYLKILELEKFVKSKNNRRD
jgi:hypothetical protein